jgi:hypothetical protein
LQRSPTHNLESLPFLADEGILGDLVAVEEHLVGVDRSSTHLLDTLRLQARLAQIEIDIKHGKSFGRLGDLLKGGRPGQQYHLGSNLRTGDPDLLPSNRITVAIFLRSRRQLQRLKTRVRLRNAKASPPLARNDLGQETTPLVWGGEFGNRLGGVYVRVDTLSTRESGATFSNTLHHHRRF